MVVQGLMPPKVSIAMLCGSGSVKMDTMNCLIQTMNQLSVMGVEHDYIALQGITGVDSARNIATSMFMERDYSHLMMIDDDMAWSSDLVYRMLRQNLDVLGVPYLRKNIKNSLWTVNHPVPDVELMDGRPYLMKVSSVATGLMMVKRTVFERLRDKVDHAIISEEKPPIPLYFRHTIDAKGKLKSEDFSFCELARGNGIDVWAWVDEETAHIGNYAYRGRYSDIVGKDMAYGGPRLDLKIMLE